VTRKPQITQITQIVRNRDADHLIFLKSNDRATAICEICVICGYFRFPTDGT